MTRNITIVALCAAVWACATPVSAKSLQACSDEYEANKAKIQGMQDRDAFVAACQKDQAVVSGATTAATPAVPPAVAKKQPATPAKSAGQASKTETEKPAAAP